MFKKLAAAALGGCLLVAALCLGLLPATALAVETNTVYVGGVALTGSSDGSVYATTNENGEVITEGATADNYNIKWDGNTLTLKGAYITKEVSTPGLSSPVEGAAIGVYNQSGDANLTITLEGTNTIEDVSYGICVLALSTGSANLTITGSDSLTASGSSRGIQVQSHNGDAAVSIQNAKVTATAEWASGVNVRCGTNSSASLTVNGGNLTSSGSQGILYDTMESSIPSTIKFIVSNSALVDARGGGIGAGNIWNLSGVSPTDGSVGIVFGHDRSDSKAGTVYGDVTLQEDLEIGEGESLTIGDGASLNTGSHEVIVNGGTLTGGDTIKGTVKYAPAITTESLPGGTVGEPYTETILAATGDASITWSVSNGSLPAGLSLSKDGKITGTPTTEGTSTFTVTATNNIGSDSREFTLKIEEPAFIPVTDLELNKGTLTLQEKDSDTLTATAEPADATNKDVTWESSDTDIATVSEDGTVTAVSAGRATITATAADASGASASCEVTVTHGNMVQTPKKDATCTAYGTEGYWTCGICGKHYKDEGGTVPTTPEDAVIPAIGHEFEGGLCSVCGARDASFSPALVSGDGSKWTKGSSKGLTFVSSAAFADLVEVRLDGRVLSASEYAVREGSTIVTLPAKLLEGLKAGDHELLIVSGSGTVRASLTVAEAAKVEGAAKTEKASADELPASGDSTAPALAVAVAAAAGAGLVLLSRRRAAR